MIKSNKKIRRLMVEYEDGVVDMFKNPVGIIALLENRNKIYEQLYGTRKLSEDEQSDEEIDVSISNINCREQEVLMCFDALFQFAEEMEILVEGDEDNDE